MLAVELVARAIVADRERQIAARARLNLRSRWRAVAQTPQPPGYAKALTPSLRKGRDRLAA